MTTMYCKCEGAKAIKKSIDYVNAYLRENLPAYQEEETSYWA